MAITSNGAVHPMRLEDLQVFLKVAELGNLHRASEALGVTASALSKTLARLETAAGLPLVERTGTGVVLTAAGHSLRLHASRVTLAMVDLRSDLDEQRQARAGTVRVGVLPVLMSSMLAPLLARFIANRPLALFSIETQLSARLLEMLQRAELDLVLAALPDRIPADLTWQPLVPLQLRVVLREGHPRRALPHRLCDLSAERWALPASSLYLRQWLDERFTSAGLPPPRVAVESTASPSAFAALLRESDLLGVMQSPLPLQAEGRGLVALEGDDLLLERELAVFWRSAGHLPPVARDFRDAVVQWR